MYHLNNDQRVYKSARKISNALQKCLEKKDFEDITVTDLCNQCKVARSTFYRCFDNIVDVLVWQCDQCFYEVMNSYHPTHFVGEKDLAKHYFAYWTKHYEIIDMILKINRQDILYECHKKNANLLAKRYGKIPGLKKGHEQYFMAIRTGFMISILTTWLKRGRKESLVELLDIIDEQIKLLKM